MNCLPASPLSFPLSLSISFTTCLSGSFFFIDFLPFAFYCQNINAADTSVQHALHFIYKRATDCCGTRGAWDVARRMARHGMVCHAVADLSLCSVCCCSLCLLCLSHNSNAKFQLKSQSQSMRNWNLIALFCNGNSQSACKAQTDRKTQRQIGEDLPQTSHIWHS